MSINNTQVDITNASNTFLVGFSKQKPQSQSTLPKPDRMFNKFVICTTKYHLQFIFIYMLTVLELYSTPPLW